jgi:sortase B
MILISVWNIIEIQRVYRAGTDSYASLEQYVSVPETIPEITRPTQAPESTPESVEATEPAQPDHTVWPSVDFAALEQINPDIVGWIYIEGTKLNYPVVQGKDNEYYLDHLFEGRYNRSGCIFLDMKCSADFSDRHSILYGHNMQNDSMFAGLLNYQDQEYYEEHPVGLLITPEKKYKILFFSGYIAGTTADAWKMDFSEDEYGTWLDKITRRSVFRGEAVPDEGDTILTLSTCTYEFDDVRFVVHGILRES